MALGDLSASNGDAIYSDQCGVYLHGEILVIIRPQLYTILRRFFPTQYFLRVENKSCQTHLPTTIGPVNQFSNGKLRFAFASIPRRVAFDDDYSD